MKALKNIFLKVICCFLSLSITIILCNKTYANTKYVWSTNVSTVPTTTSEETPISTVQNTLNLQSGSAILIDQDSGQILYEHNMHEKLRPASVTKIMSILLVMEALDSGQIKLTDKVPCSENASSMGGSQIWLTTTETLTVDEMLKCMCVVSANDCTVAMAEFLCGSTDAFVEKMNKRAKELGMNDTCFKNCHGIDEDGHVSSSYDIALMSRELLSKHPSIKNYTTIWMDSIRDGKSQLVNTNKLVRNYEGCTGLKTGSTSLALYNLSASATRDNLNLIAVIMQAPTTALRFSEAKQLLDYGFNNYTSYQLSTENEIVKNISISQGVEKNINGVYSSTNNIMLQKGSESKITQEINIPDKLTAPVSQGEKIGEINYCLDGNIISTVDVVSDKSIKKIGFVNMSTYLIKQWFTLLRA
ncbi:MAG: D-alanyl-D-alanine carboxypeptidase [Clostridia bacterium]|nr:D-alanyl-D-alanine carboxypeptidase [Clostridia bacterium]